MIRAGLAAAAALLVLLGAMALKSQLISLPSPPPTPSPTGFDADRAIERLSRILGDERPHPVDSDAGDSVRERLVAELRALGLRPRVTDDFVCNGFARYRAVSCARVRNVVATLGPEQGRHLLLSAHYDSTFAGPGAGDAGVGIATLLETAALLRSRPLSRPVTLLFNEGEEMGLLGARAFLARDPLAPRVEALLNFEARGVTGPAAMFEASRPNGAAIAWLARAVERPSANSLSTDLYRLIPNSTDVTVFEDSDWTILNFAIFGNESRYHSPGDSLAALDRSSLQHMGEQALALTLDHQRSGLPAPGGEKIFLDILGLQLVVMPVAVGLVLLAAFFLFFLFEAWRREALGRPLLAVLAAALGSTLFAAVGAAVIGLLRSGEWWRGHPDVVEMAVYASTLAACLVALGTVGRGATAGQLRAAAWLGFLAAGGIAAIIAPGGAILFLFPPAIAAIGMILGRSRPKAEAIGGIAAAIAGFLILAPTLDLFEELMMNGPHWMFAPLAFAILFPFLVELLPVLAPVPRLFLLAGAGDLMILAWVVVGLTPAYSDARPQRFGIDYVVDADARNARWTIASDGAPVSLPGPWSRQPLPHLTRDRWVSPAPLLPIPAPAVERVAETRSGERRRLVLRLRMNGAESLSLVAPPGARWARAGSRGFVMPFGGKADERATFRCVGRACDGAVIEIVAGTGQPAEILLVGTRSGLPPEGAALDRARPRLSHPQYAPDQVTMVDRIGL